MIEYSQKGVLCSFLRALAYTYPRRARNEELMTNKRTYNRIATVLAAIMLVLIAFAIPMRTASAEETTSQNIFEGATVDLVVQNNLYGEEARHENLSPVFDTTDSKFYGIDLAATLDGIRSTYKWSVVYIYINLQTPVDFSSDSFLRYTSVYTSESKTLYPVIGYSDENSDFFKALTYNEESDKFVIHDESAQIAKLRLVFPANAYETNLASILAPAIEYEAPEDDGNQSGTTQPGDDIGNPPGGDQGDTTQPGGDNSNGKDDGSQDNEQLPSPQIDIMSACVGGGIIVAFIVVLVLIPKKRK